LRARRRKRPVTAFSRQGLYFLAVLFIVFGFALLGDVNLLVVLAGILLGVLWVNWRLVGKTLRGLQLRRRMPQSVGAGDPLLVALELTNTRRRGATWAVLAQERIQAESGSGRGKPLEPMVLFSDIPARGSRTATYRVRLTHRGRYRFAAPAISTGYPFGLFRRRMMVGADQALLVLPRPGRLMPRWLERHHESFEGNRQREHRHGRISGEFYGVRPWQQGDSRRQIHWRSSARRGTLVVRQFEQHRNRDIALMIDLWQPERPAPEALENVELAVSFAATVVADTCRRGGGNLLVATSVTPAEVLRGPASPAMMQAAMETLAVAEATSDDRLEATFLGVLSALEPGVEVVLVTTRPIDLSRADRFPGLASHPAWRAIAPRIRVVNTADPGLDEYYRPE
jgi:uncharacterized protein (DUF58 family)